MFIAPLIANAPDGLFGYLQEVNGCYSIPILTIIVVGYLTKYVPAIAAKIAIISGVVLYSISQFVLNVLIMLLIGKFYPRKEAYQQEYTEQVDITPWKHLNIVGISICIIVLG